MGFPFAWKWEHKYAKNGNEMSKREGGNGNGYFFTCAKIPIGRLTLVNFGARYGSLMSPVSYQIVLIG